MVGPEQRVEQRPLLSTPIYAPSSTLNTTTRHLCCAPYVDGAFANLVIREIVEAERRAVPPSYGFDIDPVVRHCLRARRLLIARYAIVTGLLVAGLCVSPAWTIAWLTLCVGVVGIRSRAVRDLPRPIGVTVSVVGAMIVFCVVGNALLGVLFAQGLRSVVGDTRPSWPGLGESSPQQNLDDLVSAGASGFHHLAPVLLAVAMFAALFLSRRHIYGIITTELAPDARASAPPIGNSRVEWRLNAVAAMQRGNIAIHDRDPFAGAGWVEHGWSFAVALHPSVENGDGSARRQMNRVRLDAGALNRRVESAILGLRDPGLSAGERIPNIFVVPYVAADGRRRIDDPLIDPVTRIPHTLASPETLAAIENCPQGGLRHYLRAVVPATGKEIRTWDGRPVLPAQDSGTGVTAFVHLALEGGLLYAEFVATVMPPVRTRYQLGDNLRPERVAARAARHTLRSFLRDNLLGPVRLVGAGWDAVRLQSRMLRSGRAADEFRYYDYGAHFSVRELAARLPMVKFMQRLDAAKYIALMDKTVSEAVVGFLEEHGVDTTEFQKAVANVSYDMSSKTFHDGQQIFGNNNRVSQRTTTEGPKAGGQRG